MDKNYIDDRTIFSSVVGSKAYGTDTPESDTDVRGVAIMDDLKYYFGFLDRFEQFEDKVNDEVIYDIRKFFNLASASNPNILDLLFVDEKFWIKSSPAWEKVLEHRDKFLSKKARFTFVGYSISQLKRIRTHRKWLLDPPKNKPVRSDFGLPEEKIISKDDMGAYQWIMANLLNNTAEYFNGLSEETKKELKDANWIGLIQRRGIPDNCFDEAQKITGASDNFMEAMKREQAYFSAKRHYDSYTQWKKNRNPKRAEMEKKFGFDGKHASHLIRLLRMGEEILSTGKVQVFRPDREELKAIRNGLWSYDEIEQYAEDMENKIADLYETSLLPKEPNRKFINSLCIEIIEEYLKRK